MRTRVLTLLAAATAAVAAPTAASAATIVGTLAGALFGVSSSTPAIGSGTTFTSSTSLVSGSSGDFAAVPQFTLASVSAATASIGSPITLSSAFGSFTGTVTSVTASTGFSSVVSFYTLGTFVPAGSLSAFDAGAASLTFSFTQTGGAGSSVSGSYTLASPPAGVPEPATWGMMIAGAGMAGAAVRRRRSAKVVAA
ncbi:PEPxxWA-CTERM sorting domain-containing protein [Sphingomonas sp. R1]|uniref:PEPxxWA-CTERM sorting domain-containing protein n=1 Tax=Sphingomonas sp. R1 TaxID=399176 RepID=UPI002224655E|nr:PEPxxWA-CTERM sorting domain-containing protein [Sphingomonas sp. R1]UYY77822.1 PEPxxWA-CTERM sorting domain-containing protein [Sphingomonas sp. R1]